MAMVTSMATGLVPVLIKSIVNESTVHDNLIYGQLFNILLNPTLSMYEGTHPLTIKNVSIVALIGFFNYFYQYFMYRSVQQVKPSEGTLIHYSQIVIGYTIGLLFFDEQMNLYGLWGTGMIILNGIILFLKDTLVGSQWLFIIQI